TDPEPDDLGLGVRGLEGLHATGDLGEEIARLELQVVIIDPRHEARLDQQTTARSRHALKAWQCRGFHDAVIDRVARIFDALDLRDGVTELVRVDLERHARGQHVGVADDLHARTATPLVSASPLLVRQPRPGPSAGTSWHWRWTTWRSSETTSVMSRSPLGSVPISAIRVEAQPDSTMPSTRTMERTCVRRATTPGRASPVPLRRHRARYLADRARWGSKSQHTYDGAVLGN